VDYPGVFPALDTTYFNILQITNEAGNDDYPYCWTGTSAYFWLDAPTHYYAWYVAFDYAVNGNGEDINGTRAVRFDTKHEEGASWRRRRTLL